MCLYVGTKISKHRSNITKENNADKKATQKMKWRTIEQAINNAKESKKDKKNIKLQIKNNTKVIR